LVKMEAKYSPGAGGLSRNRAPRSRDSRFFERVRVRLALESQQNTQRIWGASHSSAMSHLRWGLSEQLGERT
jgi:hypothetical protein